MLKLKDFEVIYATAYQKQSQFRVKHNFHATGIDAIIV
jgi:hypothetical protein